jgi:hypothetical protein
MVLFDLGSNRDIQECLSRKRIIDPALLIRIQFKWLTISLIDAKYGSIFIVFAWGEWFQYWMSRETDDGIRCVIQSSLICHRVLRWFWQEYEDIIMWPKYSQILILRSAALQKPSVTSGSDWKMLFRLQSCLFCNLMLHFCPAWISLDEYLCPKVKKSEFR